MSLKNYVKFFLENHKTVEEFFCNNCQKEQCMLPLRQGTFKTDDDFCDLIKLSTKEPDRREFFYITENDGNSIMIPVECVNCKYIQILKISKSIAETIEMSNATIVPKNLLEQPPNMSEFVFRRFLGAKSVLQTQKDFPEICAFAIRAASEEFLKSLSDKDRFSDLIKDIKNKNLLLPKFIENLDDIRRVGNVGVHDYNELKNFSHSELELMFETLWLHVRIHYENFNIKKKIEKLKK